jgi:hypothetical protein
MSIQNILFQIKSIMYQHSLIMLINWIPAAAYNDYPLIYFYLSFIFFALKA